MEHIRFDVLGYFYGDILAVSKQDIYWIFGIVFVVLLILARLWRWILLITLNEDLAKVSGIPIVAVNWIFVLLMAMVFAVAMKLLGVLLIAALFVIPVSSARRLVKTPEMMAVLGSRFSGVSVVCGIFLSIAYDLPTGPSIVIVATIIFLISLSKKLNIAF
jgi:zinc transport system permease protein